MTLSFATSTATVLLRHRWDGVIVWHGNWRATMPSALSHMCLFSWALRSFRGFLGIETWEANVEEEDEGGMALTGHSFIIRFK